MNFHILTLFPEMVMQPLMTSITGRAVKQNKIGIEAVNIRDYTKDKHKRVDDYPYGGGAGMLMQAQPVYDACESVLQRMPEGKRRVIYVSPQGVPFTQQMAQELAEHDDLLLICGHYEGVDERVLEEVVTDVISIGDYVLTGGELAAMVIVDAVARLVPHVLNNHQSAQTESFHGNLLEYPQYSRPEVWHGKAVPKVLLSGNKKEIDIWQKHAAIQRTKERRPDLYRRYSELEECRKILMEKKLHHTDMTELVNRGRAVFVFRKEKEILLKDRESGIYFHTDLNLKGEGSASEFDALFTQNPQAPLRLHQQHIAEMLQEKYAYSLKACYRQMVYTRREKLPVSGLYSINGKTDGRYEVRPLDAKEACLPEICSLKDEFPEMEKQIKKGCVYGCFLEGKLAGTMGICSDGSMGMLFVPEKYRRNKAAAALETYLINHMLEQGMVPFIQFMEKDSAVFALQEKLGLCQAKERVFWLERE